MNIDSSWIHQLMHASKQLSIPVHLSGVLHGSDPLRNIIANMFTRFTTDTLPRVRAWVNGGQRYTITDKLIELAEKNTLPLSQRLVEATGSEHYCVTFNGLSAWDATLATMVSLHLGCMMIQTIHCCGI